MSSANNEIDRSYKELAGALPGMIQAAWDSLDQADREDIDRIAELQDAGWLYAYGVLTLRIRRHDLVRRILNYAKQRGFVVEPRLEYAVDEDEFAYRLAGRSHRMSEEELRGILQGMCCIRLRKGGQEPCIPLLKVDWQENTFDAQLVPLAKINESLNRL